MTKTIKEGNNPYNNRVYVDFEKKTIKFIPIGKRSIKKYYVMFLFNIMGLFWIMSFPIILMYSMYDSYDIAGITVSRIFTIFIIYFCIIAPLLISLMYFNKKWRKAYYPEVNYRLRKVVMKIVSFGSYKEGKKKVNPEAIINNKFFMPHFNNVMMRYKVTKDFSKYLKNITISNLFKTDAFNWFFVFEFKKKPVNGYLEVEYA